MMDEHEIDNEDTTTKLATGEQNIRSPLAVVLMGLIRLYRLVPKMQDRCRFHPTCSAYGLEALRVHGAVRGLVLIVKRILRCQPWGGTGLDPVPPRTPTSDRTGSPPVSPQSDLLAAVPSLTGQTSDKE